MKHGITVEKLLSQFTFERSSDAIFWVDEHARFLSVNQAACQNLGFTRDELLCMNVYDINPDYPKVQWNELWNRIKHEKAFTLQSHHKRKNGCVFPVEITVNYIEFEGKEYSCSFVRDITERTLQEEQIKLLAQFPADSPHPVLRISKNHTVLYANKASDQLVKTISNDNAVIKLPRWRNLINEVISSNSTKQIEHISGTQTFSLTFAPFSQSEYIHVYGYDITERKHAEEQMLFSKAKFEALFRSVGDAIVFTNPRLVIIAVNRAAIEMFGYSSEEIIGQDKSILYHSPALFQTHKQTRLCPTCKERFSPAEIECQRKDGSVFVGESLASIIKDDNGLLLGFASIIRDITERKKTEENLRNALKEVQQLKNRLEAENVYLQSEIQLQHNFEEIITQSAPLQKALQRVEQVASTDTTVLILGETGTGKELFARAIHNISHRSSRPLVKVNCAALPENLIESELFGHEKGAFTGAISRKIGRFELADNGTIFLDEIGDLPIALQSKLLRIIQEGEFERLGNPYTFKVNVRIIAATNRNLEQAVENGLFREDLYYRLNVFPIIIPPLRNRPDDIPLLINHFTGKFSARMGKKIISIPQNTLKMLTHYAWPGNVRELENIIERAVILSSSDTLATDELFGHTLNKKGSSLLDATLPEIEKKLIAETLEKCRWVIEGPHGAARRIGIPPSTLRDKIQRYGFTKPMSI
ncbi:MAG: sigma 54-interacting transcriptional regulator [bacterium]|nr:sigma 54-interacting transcriptional regulator [bacterium]